VPVGDLDRLDSLGLGDLLELLAVLVGPVRRVVARGDASARDVVMTVV
jgi:hypothetical protein